MGAAGSFLGKKDPIRDIISKLTRYAGSRLDCIHLLETLYRVLQPRVGSGDAAQEHFMSRKGPQVLVECINCWKEDEVVVRAAVRCLLPVSLHPALGEDLRRIGVRTCLEDTLDAFKLDEFISEDGQQALDSINREGRRVANSKIEEGSATENVRLIFDAIIEHPKKKDIAEKAFTALWELTQKREQIPAQIIENDGQILIMKTVRLWPAHAGVQKKAAAMVSSAAACLPFMALMGKQECVKSFIEAYHKFGNDFDVQQQVIWAMDALAQVESNVERMDRDGLKLILRELLKEDRKRVKASSSRSGRKEEKRMLWRLVPVRLRRLWTKDQLWEEYRPVPPNGDFDNPDWEDDGMHYDLRVENMSRDKYRRFEWEEEEQKEKPLLMVVEKDASESPEKPQYPSHWFAEG